VIGGAVRTESGFGTLRVPEASTVRDRLAGVIAAAETVPVAVHCCAAAPPLRLLAAAGAAAVGVDVLTSPPDHDALGELVEAGVGLWLGVVPSTGPGVPPTARDVAAAVRRLWRNLGFSPDRLSDAVTVTPTCGLAGASPGWVHSAYRVLRQASRVLAEAPEGTAV
jgi:methionine synthase II (cobalamin-independent)